MTARTLLTDARLIDPEAGTETRGDLLIENGRIARLGAGLAAAMADAPDLRRIDCAGRALAPGIVDMRVFIGEPGARHRESYRTGGLAAAAGGVTTLVAQPDTEPPVDDPAVIEFIARRAAEVCPVRVRVMGALTRGLQGRQMSEMGFLQDAGAVAFTDADRPVADPTVMARCMRYAASLGALVVHHPQEPHFARAGCATAGFFSTKLGLPGVPAMAERMMLERDLALVEMTGARYHADMLSTRGALEALRRARAQGLPVTAAASVHHLTLNEFDIADYRTFFKFDPPLRAEEDRAALVEAVAEGLIDVIVSSHLPQDEELKRLPFEQAAPGAVGLETLLPAALQMVHAGAMDLPTLFRRLSLAPARLLGLDCGRLAPGAPADLVLFDPDAPWVLDRARLRSRSKNTPFDLRRMQGRVLATFVGGRQVFDRAAEEAA
ncbi:dihydroorotase [Oceanicella actignis]|uniref:dihydroorotase n=1 Tax=Oceanicella actignis TaxID=1189325 RepID=UPI0011E673E1|nr:dihydroorotase [Oceanicella actignis]TYO91484.1 dihydroorotase [Oceanicella actignis]